MKEERESPSIGFSRRLTDGESNPFTLVEWEKRESDDPNQTVEASWRDSESARVTLETQNPSVKSE